MRIWALPGCPAGFMGYHPGRQERARRPSRRPFTFGTGASVLEIPFTSRLGLLLLALALASVAFALLRLRS